MGGTSSLDACKDLCRSEQGCVGIEYNSGSQRCEVWTRSEGIGASVQVSGYQCFRYAAGSGTTTTTTILAGEFTAVDGGSNRACRGASTSDNAASHYSLMGGTSSLDACKDLCRSEQGCVGIEYNSGSQRCEVWTRSEGIGASVQVSGYLCFRYTAGSTTTTTTTMRAGCRASASSVGSGATDAICRETCALIPGNTWPCSSDGPCDCALIVLGQVRRHRHLRASGNVLLQEASTLAQGHSEDLDEHEEL